tara:strand:+ start:2457 stop:2936 length:480 start_codon:yes stop_codon:yes gene_type:complete
MPFIVPIFANNMAKYFDAESPAYEGVKGDISNVASPGTAKAWAESIKMASGAIFPPSVTLSPAELAMFGSLAGWNAAADGAGSVLKSAIDVFYATYAPGCLPAFAAVPPVQCPIESTFASGMAGLSHTMWATNCGNTIASWINTGVWVNVNSGAAGPWV